MEIYEQLKERYEREARETERKNAEERARQQRETTLRRAASKIASVSVARQVKRTTIRPLGWHLGTEEEAGRDFPVGSSDRPARFTPLPEGKHEWQLGEDGEIYRDGKLYRQLADWQMNKLVGYLVDLAFKHHLDPELFKDNDS